MLLIDDIQFLSGKDKITETSCGIMGKDYVQGEKAGEGYCEGEESKLLD